MYTQKINYGMTEEYFGLSTDTKPTHADNGDLLMEIDTGKQFRFDEQNGVWHEQPSDGSGGGSGSDDPYPGYDVVIQVTATSASTATADVVKGDFDEVYSKAVTNAQPISILVAVMEDGANNILFGSAWCGDYGGEYIAYHGAYLNNMAQITLTYRTELIWNAEGIQVTSFESG